MIKLNLVAHVSEEWRRVPGIQGLEASSEGRLRENKGVLWTHHGAKGYPRVHVRSIKHGIYIHTAVASAFLGERPDGMEINHKDGIKSNNRPTNLEWVTRSQNMIHSYRVLGKRHPVGDGHPNTKVSDADVDEMRRLYDSSGISQSELGRRYGISQAQARLIVKRLSRNAS